MKLEEAREFTQGKRVVYIYHNVIDARGESGPTEGGTFEAVSDCIGELVELVQFCVNKLNAAKVWVTTDHGFLFRQGSPTETDRSTLAHRPEAAVRVKSRYVIGRQLGRPRRDIMAPRMSLQVPKVEWSSGSSRGQSLPLRRWSKIRSRRSDAARGGGATRDGHSPSQAVELASPGSEKVSCVSRN